MVDGWRPANDDIDEARVDEFELAHPEESLAVREALEEGPRYSLGLLRFPSGEMDPGEAVARGYLRGPVDGDYPPDDAA